MWRELIVSRQERWDRSKAGADNRAVIGVMNLELVTM